MGFGVTKPAPHQRPGHPHTPITRVSCTSNNGFAYAHKAHNNFPCSHLLYSVCHGLGAFQCLSSYLELHILLQHEMRICTQTAGTELVTDCLQLGVITLEMDAFSGDR